MKWTFRAANSPAGPVVRGASILRGTLQDQVRKAQNYSALETISKAAQPRQPGISALPFNKISDIAPTNFGDPCDRLPSRRFLPRSRFRPIQPDPGYCHALTAPPTPSTHFRPLGHAKEIKDLDRLSSLLASGVRKLYGKTSSFPAFAGMAARAGLCAPDRAQGWPRRLGRPARPARR